MTMHLPPMRLTGAKILRDGELQSRSIAFADGVITKGPLPSVDLSGYLVLPGIIDLHGDAFERHVAPRPSAPFPLLHGLASADREAAANGVTTAWFAQNWSWEGGSRSPQATLDLLRTHADFRPQMLTDIRVQIRCETHTVDTLDTLVGAVERFGIEYVVFNNHLPEALEMQRDEPEHFANWAKRHGRSAEEHLMRVNTALEEAPRVPRYLCKLVEAFDRLGVTYGSHDDIDGETRERYRMIGAHVAEFPTTQEAAAVARAMDDPVLMGAPNVVRGGSQSGNVSAMTLIREGLCSALVSDYYYPALAQAAWVLVDQGIMTLPEAWAMISETPARLMRLADRGRLDHGRRADFVVVNDETRAIEATVSGGRMTYLAGEAGRRFLLGEAEAKIAAE